jgi:formate dehydrogenase (coenzyme F420) beta subunit
MAVELNPETTGVDAGPPTNPTEAKVRDLARAALTEGRVDYFIGWRYGYDRSQVIPAFISDPAEADQLVVNGLASHNLTVFLKRKIAGLAPNAKVGVAVKGCDSRTLVALLQEELVDKGRLYVVGVPCIGTISRRKVEKQFTDEVVDIAMTPDTVTATTWEGETREFAREELLQDQCTVCRYPNPRYYDDLAGDEVEPRYVGEPQWPGIEEFEALSPAEKDAVMERIFSTCIRCFACIHACPVCYCWDQCVCRARKPALVGSKVEAKENLMFQMVHMSHVAGRCPSCGNCDRACPVEIPLYLLHRKMNKELYDMLHFEAGVNLDEKPALQTFKIDDAFGEH